MPAKGPRISAGVALAILVDARRRRQVQCGREIGSPARRATPGRTGLHSWYLPGTLMLHANPFRAPGRWLRGNTHSHSTESDGRLPLADRFAQYREGGYQFLVITDHGKVSSVAAYSSPDFLAVSGSELHPPNPYGGDRYHFVAINIHEPVPYEHAHPNEVLDAVRGQGGLAVVCHPYWCGHTQRDLEPLRGYFAVEVFNATCTRIGKGYSEPHWDDLLDLVGPCWGIAADDAHDTHEDVFQGWLMVKAPELSVPALLTALETGQFYSTQGPEILDLAWSEQEVPSGQHAPRRAPVVTVECSPVRSIVFKGQRSRGACHLAGRGEALTRASYPVLSGEKYVRVEVTDHDGRRAWSNPVYFR
jgi:predicted metal-dependent phosphoesterase TrpH